MFTISAKSASDLQQELLAYSISANVLTEFTTPPEARDVKLSWDGAATKKGMNVLGKNIFDYNLIIIPLIS